MLSSSFHRPGGAICRALPMTLLARKNRILMFFPWLTDLFHLLPAGTLTFLCRVLSKPIRINRAGYRRTTRDVISCTVGAIEAILAKYSDWRTPAHPVWVERTRTVHSQVSLATTNHLTVPCFQSQALRAAGMDRMCRGHRILLQGPFLQSSVIRNLHPPMILKSRISPFGF